VQPPQAWVVTQVDEDDGNGARRWWQLPWSAWFFKLGDDATVISFR